jgi:predicted nucleic acid-binding protein
VIVADTNLIAYLLVDGPFTAHAEAILEAEPDRAAPALWRSELANVLSLYVRTGVISLDGALRHFQRAAELLGPNELPVDHRDVLRLAEGSRSSAYDCEFVLAARTRGVPLVTADRRLLAAFPEVAVSITDFASN